MSGHLISAEQIATLIDSELSECPREVRELYVRYRVPPTRMPFARPTTLESAFVVARRGDEVLYYEEVEDGFNSSRIDSDGHIVEHWFAQDTLRVALYGWSAGTTSQTALRDDWADDVEREEPALVLAPRWLEIVAGILLGFWTLLSAAGAIAMLIAPPARKPLLVMTVGVLLLLLSAWCLDKTARLVSGRSSQSGGLLSPFALRVMSIVFLILPVAGLFTGYYASHGLLAVARAVTYVVISVVLRRIAKRREGAA